MHRDIHALSTRRFDLLVVGGGIYGLIVACDAAQRGLTVALIECGDFASGSSFNHLRTIHGGLRYLQTMDVARARESIDERRTLAYIAPDAVVPLAFALPLTMSVSRGKTAMRIAFALDAALAHDRNEGLPASHHLPHGRVLSLADTFERFPELREVPRIRGAALWYDYVTRHAERLAVAWLQAAIDGGAVAANYVEAMSLTHAGNTVTGARAIDRLTSAPLEIQAKVVVNATGSNIDRLLADVRLETGLPMIHAMNFVTTRTAPPYAYGGQATTGRNLFAVPYQGKLLIGTWESRTQAVRGDRPGSADIEVFLGEINSAFRDLKLRRDEIALIHHGVVPGLRLPDGSYALEGREQVHDHALSGVEGLISVAGTKYTTARRVAEHVVDDVVAKRGLEARPSRTAVLPLPVTVPHGDDALRSAARDEMTHSLEDVVMRRTGLGAVGNPGDEILAHAANVVGEVKGWDVLRRRAEVSALRETYGRLKA